MKKRRLCIQHLCPLGQKIEEYFFYLSKALKENSDRLVIISNGAVNCPDKERFESIADDIIVRSNQGWDGGAYAEFFINHFSPEELEQYDELTIVSHSSYGPFFPLSEMYDAMDQRTDLDFWGMCDIDQFKDVYHGINIVPYHVQIFFLVVRKKMLHSPDFMRFWRELPILTSHTTAVNDFEVKFTTFFNSLGYKSGAYVNLTQNNDINEEYLTHNSYDTYKWLKEYRCPLLRRKAFSQPHRMALSANAGATLRRTFDYIRDHTDYDENMILEDMLHRMHPNDIRTALHLDFIVNNNTHGKYSNDKTGALTAYVYDEDSLHNALSMFDESDWAAKKLLLCSDKALADRISKCDIKAFDITTELDQFVNELRNNRDLVCFYNDKIYIDDTKTLNKVTREAYSDMMRECSCKDNAFANGIFELFEANSIVGALFPPKAYFSDFFSYSIMPELSHAAKDFSLNIPETGYSPLTNNNTFWIRSELFLDFLSENQKKLNNDNIRYLGALLAQYVHTKELCSGIVSSQEYASVMSSNYQYMLDGIIHRSFGNETQICRYNDVIRLNKNLFSFCEKFKAMYIYGAGDYGHECLYNIRKRGIEFRGFIVSDGHKNTVKNVTEPIYELSEIKLADDEGIIIAMTKDWFNEVKDNFKRQDISSYTTYFDYGN